MRDGISVEQRAGIGSQTTQIGNQNNYYGMTPQEACQMAINLFYENFPKLKQYAKEVIDQRVSEYMMAIQEKLESNNIVDLTPFIDPDVQYALYESQKTYARFGGKDKLSILSELVVQRIQHNNESIAFKVAIDKAIEIAPLLNSTQLDYLSLAFLCCRVKFLSIKNVDDLHSHLVKISIAFKDADFSSAAYLNMLGCLDLRLHDTVEYYSKTYNIEQSVVRSVCPEIILQTTGDFSTSHIGTILAILNIESKTDIRLEPSKWIY